VPPPKAKVSDVEETEEEEEENEDEEEDEEDEEEVVPKTKPTKVIKTTPQAKNVPKQVPTTKAKANRSSSSSKRKARVTTIPMKRLCTADRGRPVKRFGTVSQFLKLHTYHNRTRSPEVINLSDVAVSKQFQVLFKELQPRKLFGRTVQANASLQVYNQEQIILRAIASCLQTRSACSTVLFNHIRIRIYIYTHTHIHTRTHTHTHTRTYTHTHVHTHTHAHKYTHPQSHTQPRIHALPIPHPISHTHTHTHTHTRTASISLSINLHHFILPVYAMLQQSTW
jgi:hypothetical protein